jgi:hypothetical protein
MQFFNNVRGAEVTKISTEDWAVFKRDLEANELPSLIGLMLFNIMEAAGYSAEDVRTAALTMISYAD